MELENEREIEWNFFDSILFFSFPCRAAGHVRNGRTFFLFFLCLFVLFFLFFFFVCVCVLFDIVSFFVPDWAVDYSLIRWLDWQNLPERFAIGVG